MSESRVMRPIRSFVRREGRLTPGQQKALDELWPAFGIDDTQEPINLETLFSRDAPVVLEIGFGNGASLAEMAQAQPEQNFIGIEVHRPGVGQLLNSIQTMELSNVRVACTDAVELLRNRIPDKSLDRVQIYFPDPWHKKRHHKRRIIQPSFVMMLTDKLKHGGHLHLATDWQDYAEQMLVDVSANQRFVNCGNSDGFIERPSYRPVTKFEQRGHRLGHGVWDLLFKRV